VTRFPKRVRAFAPASIGNLGPGLDVLGCAVTGSGDTVVAEWCDESGIVVRDPGTGFDPGALPHPLEPQNVLKSSGRGVFLINELMDDVAFSDSGRQVELRRKNVEAEAVSP
jgi:homoserine kinase